MWDYENNKREHFSSKWNDHVCVYMHVHDVTTGLPGLVGRLGHMGWARRAEIREQPQRAPEQTDARSIHRCVCSSRCCERLSRRTALCRAEPCRWKTQSCPAPLLRRRRQSLSAPRAAASRRDTSTFNPRSTGWSAASASQPSRSWRDEAARSRRRLCSNSWRDWRRTGPTARPRTTHRTSVSRWLLLGSVRTMRWEPQARGSTVSKHCSGARDVRQLACC